jgi:T-complex protein 1 subunit delta
LLGKGLHPSQIADAFLLAQKQSEVVLRAVAIPLELTNREALIMAAITSLNSKVVSSNADKLAPLAVDAVLRIVSDLKTAVNVDLNDIKVVKKLGGTVDDTEMVDGLVFSQAASHAAGGPTRIQNAKIALIQYCLSAPKTNMENAIVVEDSQQIDRILKQERQYIINLLRPILASGCNVLLIQKSILRDAVNELALHYLARRGIMVIKDIERGDVEFISNSLGLIPIADTTGFIPERLGEAKSVVEESTPSGKIVKVTGVKNPGRTVSILVRGSNRLVVDEAERSVHDALCVVRSLVKMRFLIAGGGAPETELSLGLSRYAATLGGMRGFCIQHYARALDMIPYTLAENAGLNPINIVTELRKQHDEGKKTAGINVKRGEITNILDENVLQPLLVSTSAVNLATEFVRMILKIDDIVAVR